MSRAFISEILRQSLEITGVSLTRADVRDLLARLDDMPERFDALIGLLDDAQAATDQAPVVVVLQIV